MGVKCEVSKPLFLIGSQNEQSSDRRLGPRPRLHHAGEHQRSAWHRLHQVHRRGHRRHGPRQRQDQGSRRPHQRRQNRSAGFPTESQQERWGQHPLPEQERHRQSLILT